MMKPAIGGLGDMAGTNEMSVMPGYRGGGGGGAPYIGGGGGGSAEDGFGQIDSGVGTVRGAINTATQALGGGGGGSQLPIGATFKKGGYVAKGGKLNLGSGRVSTASKNKSNSNW